MILVHWSHLTSKLHEMNGRERQKVMDTEMEKGEDRDIYGGEGGNDRGQKADSIAGNSEDESGGGAGSELRRQSLIAVYATPLSNPCYSVY